MTRIIKLIQGRLDELAGETWPSAEQNRQTAALTDELAALKARETLLAEIFMECHRPATSGRELRAIIIELIENNS